MDILNPIPRIEDYSKYPLEFLVGSDSFYNLIETMLEDPNKRNVISYTLLHVAARSRGDNPRAVRLLIRRGADVNSTTQFGHTPLHFAVCSRKRDTVVALIEAGASINSTDFQKRTALHFAISARWSHPPIPVVHAGYDIWIVERLLCVPEIDLNPVDQMGETPLMWAVEQQHSTAVGALLDKGADPNIPNNDKQTPLHKALSAQKPHHDIVLKLLANGAGIYSVDGLNQTPVDILLRNVKDDDTLLFAKKCITIIVLRYNIRESLKLQLEKFPVLAEHLERCSKEVRLMRKHVIYDNVTVHDFAFNCYQSPDPVNEIYLPVINILLSGLYIEYHNLILCGMSNQALRSMLEKASPEMRQLYEMY